MHLVNPEDELRRLFGGLVEQVFNAEVGICAPALTDYLSGMLADFVHMDRIYRIRTLDGQAIRDVSRLQAEADLEPDTDKPARIRLINRYIGDFTLFWTGLYPETLQSRRHFGVDRLHEYMLQGKHGYGRAGELSCPDDVPSPELLYELSQQFECCVHGLHLVRENWNNISHGPHDN